MERVCENCAREDEELVLVNRVYVVPESWDTAGSSTRMPDAELWCFSCRSLYPHEPVDPDGDADPEPAPEPADADADASVDALETDEP